MDIESKAIETKSELSSIHHRLTQSNEKSAKLISEIEESLLRIIPYDDQIAKEESSKTEDRPGLVNAIKIELRASEKNSERLAKIVRHLKTII